jgi:hypothetical protein
MHDQDIIPSQSDAVAAVAWYRPEQWENLRKISVDRNKLEATHAEWLEIAVKTLFSLREMRLDVRPIEVNVDELAHWCKNQKRKVDASARAAFAAFKLREAEENSPDSEE